MNSVESALNGFVSLHNGLILYKTSKIVMRQDNKRSDGCVKIISGGGSGHEPAHCAYVGSGMLTSTVCGDVFASPSVQAILKAILLAGDVNSNILLIVTNYTGDRINFGLASEIANCKYGYKNIKTLLIDDDCSIINIRKSVGKRGLAGTILIHKISGAMAQLGFPINEIFNYCNDLLLNEKLCTIGFTFESKNNRLENVELGKGIHGEPGIFSIENCTNFDLIIEKLIKKFIRKFDNGTKIIILFNNLGGTSEFLLSIFSGIFLKKIQNIYDVKKILCGTFLTSLKQEGISVTILAVKNDEELEIILKYLNYETSISSNVFGCNRNNFTNKSIINDEENDDLMQQGVSDGLKTNFGPIFGDCGIQFSKLALSLACKALILNTDKLNDIDKEFGDGDTGTTLNKGANALLRAIETGKLSYKYPKLLLQEISEIIQNQVGGTSGALYSLFFQSASKAFKIDEELNLKTWAQALQYGNESVMNYGLAEVGDRTMIDPLKAGENSLFNSYSSQSMLLKAMEDFTRVCTETAENTKNLQPKSGRASYTFSDDFNKSCQHPDPGAYAVGIWSNAIFEAGKIIIEKYKL